MGGKYNLNEKETDGCKNQLAGIVTQSSHRISLSM
jgi:hypothetical protein